MDGIPMKAIKETVSANAEWILEVFDNMLRKQEFPTCWNVARLVVLPKVTAREEGCRKAYNRMMGVIRIMGNKGVDYTMLVGLYKGMILAMVTYAAGAWGDSVTVRDRRKILSEQRPVGLLIIKGYRTLSGEAVRVIGGLIPLDLEIVRRWVSKMVQINGECSWERTSYSVVGHETALQRGVFEVKQRRWETSTLGQRTAGWWDDVGEPLEASKIQPAYYFTFSWGSRGL
jgi:hypothetical protein